MNGKNCIRVVLSISLAPWIVFFTMAVFTEACYESSDKSPSGITDSDLRDDEIDAELFHDQSNPRRFSPEHSKDADSQDAAQNVKNHDGQGGSDRRNTTGNGGSSGDTFNLEDASTIVSETDSSILDAGIAEKPDAQNPSESDQDSDVSQSESCSVLTELQSLGEPCWECLYITASSPATVPGCLIEEYTFEDPPCQAYYECIKIHCLSCRTQECEPDVCDCASSCLPVEIGECHERWENYASCLVTTCEGSCL